MSYTPAGTIGHEVSPQFGLGPDNLEQLQEANSNKLNVERALTRRPRSDSATLRQFVDPGALPPLWILPALRQEKPTV